MKRLVPIWLTAIAGIVMIVSYFIPWTQGWGDDVAIWFDILAGIAFILGGGNLLKIHLKKVSDKGAGWAGICGSGRDQLRRRGHRPPQTIL